MKITVGFIPFLNMVPFHQGFGPEPITDGDLIIDFRRLSPRALGAEALAQQIDAGALSMVDSFHGAEHYEPLGAYGIGVKERAESVLLFSSRPIAEFQGMCAVTDQTSTSFCLLQTLLEKRYQRPGVTYGRISSWLLYDGSAEGVLLIGDEALAARETGIKGLPFVADLAQEWFAWQKTPFCFAQWMVRRSLPGVVKDKLKGYLEKSLNTAISESSEACKKAALARGLTPRQTREYWDGFVYQLTPEHQRSIAKFKVFTETLCLTV